MNGTKTTTSINENSVATLRPKIALVVRLLLAGVFLWAAIAKAISGPIANTMYGALVSHGEMFHYAMITGEVGLAAWLITGWRPRASALAVVLLLSVFSGGILVELRSKHPRPCGCMSAAAKEARDQAIQRSLMWSLVRNGLMVIAASWLVLIATPGPIPGEKSLADYP